MGIRQGFVVVERLVVRTPHLCVSLPGIPTSAILRRRSRKRCDAAHRCGVTLVNWTAQRAVRAVIGRRASTSGIHSDDQPRFFQFGVGASTRQSVHEYLGNRYTFHIDWRSI